MPKTTKCTDPDPVAVTTGDLVRRARADAGMTREALAFRAGVAVRTLARIESEGHIPSARVFARIARELGRTVDDLLGHDAAA